VVMLIRILDLLDSSTKVLTNAGGAEWRGSASDGHWRQTEQHLIKHMFAYVL
jgi:hypothetical protein